MQQKFLFGHFKTLLVAGQLAQVPHGCGKEDITLSIDREFASQTASNAEAPWAHEHFIEDSVHKINIVPQLNLAVELPLPVQIRGVTMIMISYTTCQQIALRRRVDDVHNSRRPTTSLQSPRRRGACWGFLVCIAAGKDSTSEPNDVFGKRD
jgi:hypothetical protein